MPQFQASLFEDHVIATPDPVKLVLRSRPNRPLTKAQRLFNRLIAQVEQLRADLVENTQWLDEALAYYGTHLHGRLQRQTAVRKELVRLLAPFLNSQALKGRNQRSVLRSIIAEKLIEIQEVEGTLVDDDLQRLFEQVHGVGFEQAQSEEMLSVRSAIEEMLEDFGIDVDFPELRPGMSEAEFAAKTAEIADRIQQKVQEEGSEFSGRPRARTKRQVEQEQRGRQVEEMRKKSIASIYRQLAKALHPDLEMDPVVRERKVTLMQELTTAYGKNDLHTLLRLELRWIQNEQNELERLTEEKLAIYNDTLRQQVYELKQELADLPYHPRFRPLVVHDDPFGLHLRTDGPAEARALDDMTDSMEASIARLKTKDAIKEVRGAIRACRTPF